jgi:hypothetical protein
MGAQLVGLTGGPFARCVASFARGHPSERQRSRGQAGKSRWFRYTDGRRGAEARRRGSRLNSRGNLMIMWESGARHVYGVARLTVGRRTIVG